MMKNGVIAEKKDNKLSFYSFSETFGCNYLYTKPFTQGEWKYFPKARELCSLRSSYKLSRETGGCER